MFNKTELNEKLTAELREIAKTQGILNADELRKAELVEIIAQITEQEADAPAPEVTEVAAPAKVSKAKTVKDTGTAEKPTRKRIRIPAKEEEGPTTKPFNRASLFDPLPGSEQRYAEEAIEEVTISDAEPQIEAIETPSEVTET